MIVMSQLVKAIRNAAIFNPEIQVAPACILWPDRDRQWEVIIPMLQAEMPELMILGDYAPEKRMGPAIWLRCVLAKTISLSTEDTESTKKENNNSVSSVSSVFSVDKIPILYLPGVSRQDLRAVENCPDLLKPLAELQYRGVIWSQVNAKDWTILAFLVSDQGGLGLNVTQDSDTKTAMQLALPRLLLVDVDYLKDKPLNKDYFNTLLIGGDPIKEVLQWLDHETAFKTTRQKNEWLGFVEICKSRLAFNPEREGILAGAAKLANHAGEWQRVWERYCEAPGKYPNIPVLIRKCQMPNPGIFDNESTLGGWPQWNELEEHSLRSSLLALEGALPQSVRNELLKLEDFHGQRRQLVWAELNEAPLAITLEKLLLIAELTQNSMAVGTLDELLITYQSVGWKVDDAVLRALSTVDTATDLKAVSAVIRALYLPWLDEGASYLQKLVTLSQYPGGNIDTVKPISYPDGQCVLFVDGLRFDAAKRLVDRLVKRGLHVEEQSIWSALPSVTATGKAAVAPVREKIRGEEGNNDFEPCVSTTGQSLKGGYHLKKLLLDSGWQILERTDCGDGNGNAWCEFGDIDHEGHDRGWKLARHLDGLLKEVTERIQALLSAGWKGVRVVTDHGWLLLPGGLPKIELSSALAENKWGRCACLKPGASTEQFVYSWFWNPYHHFVLAHGVGCFKHGEEYTHGGLSLQECLVLQLTVSQRGVQSLVPLAVTDIGWKGLRCTVVVEGSFNGLFLDIRQAAADASSSLVLAIKPIKENGTASVVVEDEELDGKKAFLVFIDESGHLQAQLDTVIGGV